MASSRQPGGRAIRKQQRWSKELILAKIGRRRSEGRSLAAGVVQKENSRLFGAASRYFGAWEKAMRAAGLDYAKVRKTTTTPAMRTARVMTTPRSA